MQPELLSLVLDPVSGLLLPVSDLEPVLGLAVGLVSALVLAPDSVSVTDLVLVLGMHLLNSLQYILRN